MGHRTLSRDQIKEALDRVRLVTESEAAELKIDLDELDTRLAQVRTLQDWSDFVCEVKVISPIAAAILEYPLPILTAPGLVNRRGLERKGLKRVLKYESPGRLPLSSKTPMGYRVTRAFTLVIHDPDLGRKVDLEAWAALEDASKGRPAQSYRLALLYLRRLWWLERRVELDAE